MKRNLSVLTIISIIAASCGSAQAIPTFGTLMPEKGKYQGGARANFIFDREVNEYDNAKMFSYSYKMSYGFTDWFCFDGLIGFGSVMAEHENESQLRYPYNFNGGYGWRAKIYKDEERAIDWVWGFQHVSTHPDKQRYRGRKHEIIWDEWQVSTVMSKHIWRFTPYCGAKWSFTYLISKIDNNRHRRMSNGPPIGLVIGSDMRLGDYAYLNMEGRFFDETAMNAGFTIKY